MSRNRVVLDGSKKYPIADYIRKFTRHRNYMAAICGNPQSGKSTLCQSLACAIYEGKGEKYPIGNTVFTGKEFLKKVNDPSLRRGDVIIVEEAGVMADRTKWYSFLNRAIVYVAQTFGYKGLIVFFNLPSLKLLDSRVVHLLNGYFETLALNQWKKTVRFMFNTIEYQKKIAVGGKDIYYYRPMLKTLGPTGDNMMTLVNTMCMPWPPDDERKEYFMRAIPYKESISRGLEEESIKLETPKGRWTMDESISRLRALPNMDFLMGKRGSLDEYKVAPFLGIGQGQARQVIGKMELLYHLESTNKLKSTSKRTNAHSINSSVSYGTTGVNLNAPTREEDRVS